MLASINTSCTQSIQILAVVGNSNKTSPVRDSKRETVLFCNGSLKVLNQVEEHCLEGTSAQWENLATSKLFVSFASNPKHGKFNRGIVCLL